MNKGNSKVVVMNFAIQKLIQKPYLLVSCWRNTFQNLKTWPDFSSRRNLDKLYSRVKLAQRR